MKRISVSLLCVLALAIAACGSRADGPTGGGDGLGAPTSAGEGGGGDASADSKTIGTIDNPCSGEAAKGALTEGTPGVTEDSIRIGVISDKESPIVPLPTIGIEEAVKAFVDFCNEAGGINGRQLELKTYDSEIVKVDDVTKQACADDLFALVGSGSVQDQQGIETRVGCKLPEVAAYSATAERSVSDLFFTAVPGNLPDEYNIGPCQRIEKEFPDAVKKAAMVYTDLPAAANRGKQIIENCEKEAGFEFVVDAGIPFGEKNFGPLVSQMKSKGIKYFSMVSAVPDTLSLLREIKAQGIELEVIDLGQQYYDPSVLEEPAADGAHVLTNTVPFSEADDNPALKLYQEYLKKADGQETTLGVQAFSSALLFATAAQSLGNDITREALVEALGDIKEWDGGGLHMTANPGDNEHISCFLYLKVEGGEFKREFPEKDFECDPSQVVKS